MGRAQVDGEVRSPRRLLTAAIVLTGLVLAWLSWNTYDAYRTTTAGRQRERRITELRGVIVHLDEVLTMSARMAAATGDGRWKERYDRFEPQLTAAIEEAVDLVPQAAAGDTAAQTDAANMELIRIESEAFRLVADGRGSEAQALLEGQAYARQKRIYAEGMERFAAHLADAVASASVVAERKAITHSVIALAVIPFVLAGWLVALRTLNRWERLLRERNRVLRGQTEHLEGLIGRAGHSAVQVSAASNQLATLSQQLRAMMTEQLASTQEVTATAGQISSNAHELARTMNDVAGVSRHAAQAAGEGRAGLQDMQATMEGMEAAAEDITSQLQAIRSRARKITDVITTITTVADQTNLLSLNAAIEAEKAGELGKGFGVVAQEIRRLADQTAVATLEIERSVEQMMSSVETGVAGIQRFSQDVHEAVTSVRGVGHGLTRVADRVQELDPRFAEVKEGMDAQEQGARRIRDAMVQLNEASKETASSLATAGDAIERLNAAAGELRVGIPNPEP